MVVLSIRKFIEDSSFLEVVVICSPEELSVLIWTPMFREPYANKSDSNQKFFTPDGSEELVRGSGGVGLQQLRSHQRHFWPDQALGNC